jgi:hypothetical protein
MCCWVGGCILNSRGGSGEVVRVDDAFVWAALSCRAVEEVLAASLHGHFADAAVVGEVCVEVAVAGPDRVGHMYFAFGGA